LEHSGVAFNKLELEFKLLISGGPALHTFGFTGGFLLGGEFLDDLGNLLLSGAITLVRSGTTAADNTFAITVIN
jgi:hypothetical protein